jgi:hypothetical protein
MQSSLPTHCASAKRALVVASCFSPGSHNLPPHHRLPPSRSFGTISLLFIPALAWVGFNMLGPLNNQLNRMNELASDSAPRGKRRGIAGAVGLGAALSLAAAQQADAATELAQLAGSDGR